MSTALQIISREFNNLNMNPLSNIGLCVGLADPKNLFEWRCTMTGPGDSNYAGGLFYIRVIFPKNYPNSKPEVRFITPIYHLNINPSQQYSEEIDPLGHVCISTINKWDDNMANPETKKNCNMASVFKDIFALFYIPNPNSPFSPEMRDEFKKTKNLYEKKVKYFTKKYATPFVGYKVYKNWDFSYSAN